MEDGFEHNTCIEFIQYLKKAGNRMEEGAEETKDKVD